MHLLMAGWWQGWSRAKGTGPHRGPAQDMGVMRLCVGKHFAKGTLERVNHSTEGHSREEREKKNDLSN